MKRPPTPLAVALRRVRQLERCLGDLGRILDVRHRELSWYCSDSNPKEQRLILQLARRIGRSIQPRKPYHENHP
jgi:hypothetical protein